MVDTTEVEGDPSQETAENQVKNKSRLQESPSSGESGPLADIRPQRSTEEILKTATEEAKAAGEEIPESAYEQYLRGIRKYHQAVTLEQTPQPRTEKPPTVEKQELKESNDVFFRDQLTGSPNRLHITIGVGPRGEKETKPVILPPIPENWIVKVPQGLGGGEQHYRLSKSEDAEKAIKEKLGLGMISATDRGIMIVDFVPHQEIPKLESQGDKIVHIDEVRQKLIGGESHAKSEKPKASEAKVPEGLVEIWEYRPTEPSEYNIKQLPFLIPPLDEIERDESKTPIFEVYLPKGEKEYYTPITATMMLARAQHEFKNKVSDISPENILLVFKTPESTVKNLLKRQRDKFEKISVSKAIREYQESKSKKKPA